MFGFEGDFDYTDMDGTAEVTDLFDDSLTLETSWQGSLRARMGYAADTWLIYATGGVAVGRAKLSGARYSLDVLLLSASDSNTHIGFTAGAGVEKAFTPHWTGRAEVRYTNFGSEDYDLGNIGNPVHSYWHQATATLGISYKF